MPFKSDAQRRWMYAQHPSMAKRWSKETPKNASLPERVSKGSARLSAMKKRLGGK